MKKKLNTAILREVSVVSVKDWNRIRGSEWAVCDPDGVFAVKWDSPVCILGSFPEAEEAKQICSRMMNATIESGEIDELYNKLVQVAGIVSAEWFFRRE